MAVQVVGLGTQLNNKLGDSEIPLEKRLEVAHIVFTSESIPILRKEELILQWICNLLESTDSVDTEGEILSCLLSCLSSHWMKSFNGQIKPAITESLMNIFFRVADMEDDKLKSFTQECIVVMLESAFYQRWFTRDVLTLSSLAECYFKSIDSDSDVSQFARVLQILLTISKHTLLKDDFRLGFIKNMFISMAKAVVELVGNNSSSVNHQFSRCISQILLYEQSFASNLIKSFQTKLDHSPCIEEFLSVMKKIPTCCDERVVTLCFISYLKAVMEKGKDNNNLIFHTFTYLCSVLGVSVHKVKSISKKPIKNWSNEQSFEVMGKLVKFLDSNNLPFNCDLNEVSLQDWFTCVITGMVCINVRDLTPELITLVHSIIAYNPLVLENAVRSIAIIMLQKKESEEITSKYIALMKSVWEGLIKANRFQKFLARFLPLLNEIMKFSCDGTIKLNDIFPKEVSDSFSYSVMMLPSSQMLALMKSILFHLENDCLEKLDNEDLPLDADIVVPTEVVSELMSQFLRGVRIADNSLSDTVREKFDHMISDLEELLTKICSTILHHCHHDRLLTCFLKLCHMLGKLQLLIREYNGAVLKEIDPTDLLPTNLSYVHPYIAPDHWILIAQRVENHNCQETKNIFHLLLVQKMEAVSQVEVGDEGPGTLAARYLFSHAPASWYWDQARVLSKLLEPKELVQLVSKMVEISKHNASMWIPIVTQDPFLKNRHWALATVLMFLKKISFRIHKNKKGGAWSKTVTSETEEWMFTFLEYELSRCVSSEEAFPEGDLNYFLTHVDILAQKAIKQYQSFTITENLSLTSDLYVLNLIPVHHFGEMCQTLIMLTILVLLVDLPPDKENDEYLFNMILSMLEGTVKTYASYFKIDCGLLLKFLVERCKGYKHYKRLLERFCFLALMSDVRAKQLIKYVRNPTKDTVWLTSLVIRMFLQLKKKELWDSDNEDKNQAVSRLVSSSLQVVNNETPSLQLLAPFSTVVRHLLTTSDAIPSTLRSSYIPKYTDIAIENYKEDTYLLETLLKYHSELGIKKGNEIMVKAWRLMINSDDEWPKPLLSYVLQFSTNKELESMFRLLLEKTVEECTKDEFCIQSVKKYFSLWQCIVNLGSNEKGKLIKNAITWLTNDPLLHLASDWLSFSKTECVQPVLEFIELVGHTPSVELQSCVLDTFFEVLSCVPYPMEEPEILVKHVDLVQDSLFAFYHFRKSLILDRIPVLLQRYRTCMKKLAECSVKTELPENSDLFNSFQHCAHKLEKGALAMVKRSKDFGRIAPYLVADIIDIFDKYKMLHSIKQYYTKCVNAFLSIVDGHGIKYLSSALSPPCQELFKVIYSDYKKYYKYTGKV